MDLNTSDMEIEIDEGLVSNNLPSSPLTGLTSPAHASTSSISTIGGPVTPTRRSSQRSNTRHPRFIADSDSEDEDGEGLVGRINRERRQKREMTMNPLASSSPIRETKKSPRYLSKAVGERYTLRSAKYIPFRSQRKQREQRRLDTQMAVRGGIDAMNRGISENQERERLRRLTQEAEAEAARYQLEEIDEEEEEEEEEEYRGDDEFFYGGGGRLHEEAKRKRYEMELEMMLRQEEEELEAMLSNVHLGG